MKVNLGCPRYCEGWACVDLFPEDSRVEKMDAVDWLFRRKEEVDEIQALNLLEHLPNVGTFFKAAHSALKPSGILTVVTDNAEWPFSYIPIINMLSWGHHASRKYKPIVDKTKWHQNVGVGHCAIFTKLHLENYAERYGFEIVSCKRIICGIRLKAVFRKRSSQ